MQSLMTTNKTERTSARSSNNTNLMLLLRRGWTVRRLWILSIVGVAGLGLDAVFHTLDSGTPLTIIFDGADFSTGQMVLESSPEVATLSWVGHTLFLTAFALLIVLPKLFFETSQTLRGTDGRNWAVLKKGRSVKQLWIIAMVGVAGMALDIAFHWLQDGSVDETTFITPRAIVVGSIMLRCLHNFLIFFSIDGLGYNSLKFFTRSCLQD